MYCQTCGNPLNENLNYCNRCGSKVTGGELTRSANLTGEALSNLSASMGYVGVAGLGGFVGLMAILIGNSVAPELVAVLALIFAATAFGICFIMMRQMSRLTRFEQSGGEISNRRSSPEQLNVPATGQIEAARRTFASVTENTTRTLDDVSAKRN